MNKGRKFIKQANRGRRPFSDNFHRATEGLEIAVFSDKELTAPPVAAESIRDKIARLGAHVEANPNDGDARKRYAELNILFRTKEAPAKPTFTLELPISVGRRPELIGFGGGSGGWPEVHLPAWSTEIKLSDEDWQILAQCVAVGAFGQ